MVVPTSSARPWRGPGDLGEGRSVEEDVATVAGHRRIETELVRPRVLRSPSRSGASPAAACGSGPRRGPRARVRQARRKRPSRWLSCGRQRREQLGALLHLDQALAALALLDARGRHVTPERLRALEERLPLARGTARRRRSSPSRARGVGDGRAHDAAAPGRREPWRRPRPARRSGAGRARRRWRRRRRSRRPRCASRTAAVTGAPPMQILTSWRPASLNFCTTVRM